MMFQNLQAKLEEACRKWKVSEGPSSEKVGTSPPSDGPKRGAVESTNPELGKKGRKWPLGLHLQGLH